CILIFFFQAEDGIRDLYVTGVQTCALPISRASHKEAKKVAAASRSASKGRTATKAPAAKSSKNKRSAMPNKTAKPAVKATVAKRSEERRVGKECRSRW